MSSWHKEPPTHQEWRDANNHGCWWVKFLLMPETTEPHKDGGTITWPEAWLTEIVSISVSYKQGMMLAPEGATLHATGTTGLKFDLDDKEKTKDMYWQPVLPPLDDVKDKRPEVD